MQHRSPRSSSQTRAGVVTVSGPAGPRAGQPCGRFSQPRVTPRSEIPSSLLGVQGTAALGAALSLGCWVEATTVRDAAPGAD